MDPLTGCNLAQYSIMNRRIDILEMLVAAANVSGNTRKECELRELSWSALNSMFRKSDGTNCLMMACSQGDEEAIRVLLAAGSDPWAKEPVLHRTCVHYAVNHDRANVLPTIVSKSHLQARDQRSDDRSIPRSPLVDVCTRSGFTALMNAAWMNKPEAIRVLIGELGAGFKPRYFKKSSSKKGPSFKVGLLSQVRRGTSPRFLPDGGRLVDPRFFLDCQHRRPYDVALELGQREVMDLLNPDFILQEILGDHVETDESAYGALALTHISAKVVQKIFLSQIEAILASTGTAEAGTDIHPAGKHHRHSRGRHRHTPSRQTPPGTAEAGTDIHPAGKHHRHSRGRHRHTPSRQTPQAQQRQAPTYTQQANTTGTAEAGTDILSIQSTCFY
ncbi:hypothetical protein CEUSTIGMA_g11152.t1 [Chlamydomonas eustigma]|uniref:Uncharacterized protein n=1 Tax=Chlamydomonas eustigma TaxID=1157962 RepID=A0A250XKY3_9CHLO|nr:hypothetical protein CEUSTIGMA_g11152.t1 [Chlamydomonas eustigma]|eukprot:GAX83727.1 hypothetical protein CEUSTIGMA_g11152.t1 [Chlamydomonas eustigma]